MLPAKVADTFRMLPAKMCFTSRNGSQILNFIIYSVRAHIIFAAKMFLFMCAILMRQTFFTPAHYERFVQNNI